MRYVFFCFSLQFLLTAASTGCPNACSGHGDCGADDVCQCYAGYKAGDCSYRECPYGISWSVTSNSILNDDRSGNEYGLKSPGFWPLASMAKLPPGITGGNRVYAECSNRGICDSSTGICKCFKGFSGRGCRRSECPNKCSGHGRCITMDTTETLFKSAVAANDGQWDQDKTQWCKCDRGYTGFDCSERSCPVGDNPSTTCEDASSDDIQLVYLEASHPSTEKQYFSLDFTDAFGGTFTTRPIDISKCTPGQPCQEVQFALMELPNFAIPEIQVEEVSKAKIDTSVGQHAYFIRFTDKANPGKQNTLKCNSIENPSVHGAAPMFNKVPFCTVLHVGQPEWSESETGSLSINGKNYFYDELHGDGNTTWSKCNALKKDCRLQDFTISASTSHDLGTAGNLEQCLSLVAQSKFVYSTTGVNFQGGKCTAHIGGSAGAIGLGTGKSCILTKSTCAKRYAEFVPCSSRGTCDKTTGVCKCQNGAHGGACDVQNTYA